MAIVRRPNPAPEPEGEGMGQDRYVGPLKTVDEVKFYGLRPDGPAPTARAADPPAPAPTPASPAPEPPPKTAKPAKALPRIVSRLTAFTDLDLGPDVGNDPDAKRYFDYVRLFTNDQVPGGLYGLPFDRARQALQAGRWGRKFTVDLEQLIAGGLYGSRTLLASRFYGMRPVYKAFASAFPNERQLRAAIGEDLHLFLKHQKPSNKFPPFAYRVASHLPQSSSF